MGITKMGSEPSTVVEPPLSMEEYFKKNKFKELFSRASAIKNTSEEKGKELKPFYKLLDDGSIKRIIDNSSIDSFLEELNVFLDNPSFTDNEKRSFLNGKEDTCVIQALHANKFPIAENINKYRRDKNIENCKMFMKNRAKAEEYELLDQFLSLSTSIAYNSSELLRLLFINGCRDYGYFKKLINEHGLDINGLGTTYENPSVVTFAQFVCVRTGTKTTELFEKFMKEYGNQVNFDVQYIDGNNKVRKNILEHIISSDWEATEKLSRLQIILDNCNLSVKHIGFICQHLLSEKNTFASKYFDHSVYDSLFAHENFNSNLFDREAILNKLMSLDTNVKFYEVRKNSNNTVNATSVILDKFFKNATRPIPKEKHPFAVWVKQQKAEFSIDTLKSLTHHFADEMNTIGLQKMIVGGDLKRALKENGLIYPERTGIMSFLFGRENPEAANSPVEKTVITTPIRLITQNVFNDGLFEQVRNEEIKKFINSIKINYEQYHSMTTGDVLNDNVHYMNNLLPKFLNSVVENYLHFSTLDEQEATANTLIQLKMMNKKTFEVLSAELSSEQDKLSTKTRVQGKVMQQYK